MPRSHGDSEAGRQPDITRLLQDGASSSNELLEAVYDQLRAIAARRLADERADHTLQPTALVHEAYMRLLGNAPLSWEGRAHFYGAAAEAMRRILIDHARTKGRKKRGGDRKRLPMSMIDLAAEADPEQILELDGAIQQLEEESPRAAEIVRLRFFAGLTAANAAEVMGISERTLMREWVFARARLYELLSAGDPD